MSTSDRLPPQAIDIERTVLGSILIDSSVMDQAIEYLAEDCFYATKNKYIFSCIRDMVVKNIPVDIITLTESLRKRELLDKIGSESYLSDLIENVATSANISYHIEILKGKATLRSLLAATGEIATDCLSPDAEARQAVDRAEERIFRISDDKTNSTFEALETILPRTYQNIDRYAVTGCSGGIMTGFEKLDELTAGFMPGNFIIVAGRPSMGKTAFCLSIAQNIAVENKNQHAIAIFSLEMSKEELSQRLLCAKAKVDIHHLRSGKLEKKEFTKLSDAGTPLFKAPIYIEDTPAINVIELRSKARRLKVSKNIELIIIDYLQLMRGVEKGENRQAEISEISRGLKAIAKELNIPVIALSQLSRAVEQRGGDHRPQLSDLRESGAIEQDADCVMFVYREHVYKPEDPSLKNLAEIIIGKQRNGPIGTAKVAFIPEYAHFMNLDTIHSDDSGF